MNGLLQTNGKTLAREAKYQWWAHRTRSTVTLGLLGAALTAASVLKAKRRAGAMHGKVVVITGGSRGFGLEIARVFGRNGAHLVLAARQQDELQRAVASLQQSGAIANASAAQMVVCDVTKPEDCTRLADQATGRFGRIDVLINVAGVMEVGPFQDQPLSAYQEAMDLNFYGALHTIQAIAPQMLGRRDGRIVNIASLGGKIGVPHMLPYVASKYALVGFSEGLRAELGGTGVSVTTINPGIMRTGSHVHARFRGDAQGEYEWFSMGALIPGSSISAEAAARKVYRAAVDRTAEVMITPQAWLAARIVGIAPGFASDAASILNRLLLPKPNGNTVSVAGEQLKQPKFGPLRRWSEHLQTAHNAKAD